MKCVLDSDSCTVEGWDKSSPKLKITKKRPAVRLNAGYALKNLSIETIIMMTYAMHMQTHFSNDCPIRPHIVMYVCIMYY